MSEFFYYTSLSILFLFAVYRFWLSQRYIQATKQPRKSGDVSPYNRVTIQIPVYNERFVIGRLLQAISELKYPKSLLTVQVLDDSDDNTTVIIERELQQLKVKGMEVEHVRRSNRDGFKAGALAEGLARTQTEFITIFDADFVPSPTFLLETLPHFSNPNVAVVQAKWSYLNPHASLLSSVQKILLDAHFEIEQQVRHTDGYFLHFNGTAGVWRKSAIVEAKGWLADTLTEDLDLSFRVQQRGWKIVFLRDVEVPCELPTDFPTVRSQQYRWAKGSAQVFRKLSGEILSSDLSWNVKLEALLHLGSHAVYVAILAMVLSFPWVLKNRGELSVLNWVDTVLLLSAAGAIARFFILPQPIGEKGAVRKIFIFILALFSGAALAVNNSLATLDGLLHRRGIFVRTPKRGDETASTRERTYFSSVGYVGWLEALVSLYLWCALIMLLRRSHWVPIPLYLGFSVSVTWPTASSLCWFIRNCFSEMRLQRFREEPGVQRQIG